MGEVGHDPVACCFFCLESSSPGHPCISIFCLFQVLAQMSLTFPVGASLTTLMESETLFPSCLDCVILFHSIYHHHTRHWRIFLKVMCNPSFPRGFSLFFCIPGPRIAYDSYVSYSICIVVRSRHKTRACSQTSCRKASGLIACSVSNLNFGIR